MIRYKNLSGQSGVLAYEIGDDFINVKFEKISKDGFNTYKYSRLHAGLFNVDRMKQLATLGEGLNSFINLNVKNSYESKHYTP